MGKAQTKIKQFNDFYGYKSWDLSDEQKQLGNKMKENSLIFVTGKAGCGKTAGVLYHYIQEYLSDKTKNIVVIRTPVEAGDDKIGALPNGVMDKIEPHFKPARNILEELLSANKVECDLGKRIHFTIPNFALGDTFNDSLIVISEAQQISPLTLKLLLERIGQRSTCVVEGDPTQLYATNGKRNGLSHAINTFEHDISSKKPIDIFEFSNKVNQRSEIVQLVNDAYSKIGL